MNKLIKSMESLNRKERFAVFKEISGLNESDFPLCANFRNNLDTCIGNVGVPKVVFCATDYHLDWIELALLTFNKGISTDSGTNIKKVCSEINQNQQDIDLLIAFTTESDPQHTHLVLIEAKAYGTWENKQLRSKSARLQTIFGECGEKVSEVTPHFVLLTNRKSKLIDTKSWPCWMKDTKGKPIWLKYSRQLPPRLKPTRCSSSGRNDANGGHIRFDCVPSQS